MNGIVVGYNGTTFPRFAVSMIFVYFPKFDIYDPYSYGHLPLISTYNPFMEYNPIYNQL